MSAYHEFEILRISPQGPTLHAVIKLYKHDQHVAANIKALQSLSNTMVAAVREVKSEDPRQAEWRKQVGHGQTQLGFLEWKKEKYNE